MAARTTDEQNNNPVPKLPTVDEVRKAIPPHCFEKNLVTSIRYLIQDYVLLAALYMVVPYAEQYLGVVGYLTWNPVYTIIGKPDGSHFWPWSRLFTTTEDRVKCVVALHMVDYSAYNWVKYYYIPLLFQGLILVIITYLQHTDDEIEVIALIRVADLALRSEVQRRRLFVWKMHCFRKRDQLIDHDDQRLILQVYEHDEWTFILEPLKGTPYEYKSKTNYDFFFRYLQQNFRLDYLTYKSKGVMQYRVGLEAQQNKAK
ncbi:unnamed protein product [Nippostrongylus brasiliensis]|uniref:Transmembrane protein n=1 Tax=Nippostrongylus brasiliensis TaxID=27835 RepID=A0A158R1E0_NIPBR|nr:unnamed protein product [Nippostrongylus brasiliensis]